MSGSLGSEYQGKDGDICILWDVEDYPIPDGSDPDLMLQEMITVLKDENYCGELSIKAYADKYTLSDEMRHIYDSAGFPLDTLPKGKKNLRISPMVVDLYLWAFENPAPANMIVLSKNIGKFTLSAFKSFAMYGHSVALDYPYSDWLPTEVYGQLPR